MMPFVAFSINLTVASSGHSRIVGLGYLVELFSTAAGVACHPTRPECLPEVSGDRLIRSKW